MPRSPNRRRRQLAIVPLKLLVILPMLVAATGCTESPTSPSYPFAGRWVGNFYDHNLLFYTGSAVLGGLTIEVAKDGSATGTGRREFPLSATEKLVDQVEFTLTVMPDGAVTGTGSWTVTAPGLSVSREGIITGQFDLSTECGDGVLEWEVQGAPWHLPWHVEKDRSR